MNMNIEEELCNPSLIFHYTKAHTSIEYILHGGALRFSSMERMNDPYEYKIPSLAILGNIDVHDNRKLSHFLREAALKRSKLASFVAAVNGDFENPFSRPYAKPRSWAQYGDVQRGVCLVFNKNKLLDNLRKSVSETAIFEGQVEYNLGDGFASAKAMVRYNGSLSLEQNVYNHLEANKADVYFRKYADFKDEMEYRIVVLDRSEKYQNQLFCPISGALEYIVLGDRFSEVYYSLMKEFALKYSVKALKLIYGRVPYIDELSNA